MILCPQCAWKHGPHLVLLPGFHMNQLERLRSSFSEALNSPEERQPNIGVERGQKKYNRKEK